MAAPVRTWCCSVLKLSRKPFSTTCAAPIGEKWRKEHGLARTGTEYGPMTDLPDWSYADGRPAPPMKGYLRRREQNEELARRIVMLNEEVDRGIETCKKKKEEQKMKEEHRKSLVLKAKGKALLKNKSQS